MTTATPCTQHTWDYCGATRNAKTGVVEYKIFQCRKCKQRKFEPMPAAVQTALFRDIRSPK